mgnify:CR=1 FL=1
MLKKNNAQSDVVYTIGKNSRFKGKGAAPANTIQTKIVTLFQGEEGDSSTAKHAPLMPFKKSPIPEPKDFNG